MIYRKIKLRDYYPMLESVGGDPTLEIYARSNSREIDLDRRYPGMLICPGGAYAFVSDREAEPVALKYLDSGFNCFVLTYSVAPAHYPQQLLQAAAAMNYIRKTADELHTYPDRVSVSGFSAGGHLAASLSCLWHEDVLSATLGEDSESFRPDASVLCYPVITGGIFTHGGSFQNLCAGDEKLVEKLSLENAVDGRTAPAFIWHTAADGGVPVENSMFYAAAMRKNDRPFELHIFRTGCHGLSLCNYDTAGPKNPDLIHEADSAWFDMSVTFLNNLFEGK